MTFKDSGGFLLLAACLASAHGFSFFGIHTCQEGHVCVYQRGSAVLETVSGPGYHWKLPLLTDHHNVQVTRQTDRLQAVECGSSKGATVGLDIEVVNQLRGTPACVLQTVRQHTLDYDKSLIFDAIPSETAAFCKNYPIEEIVITKFDELDDVLLRKLREHVKENAPQDPNTGEPCLQIHKVYIRRPTLPPKMREAFEAIELEQKQKDLEEQKKQTERVRLEAQTEKEVMGRQREQRKAEITQQTKTMEATQEAERQAIIDKREADTKRSGAESERFRLEQMALGNQALFTEAYVRLEGIRAAHHNAKLILGDAPQNALSFLKLDPTAQPTCSQP